MPALPFRCPEYLCLLKIKFTWFFSSPMWIASKILSSELLNHQHIHHSSLSLFWHFVSFPLFISSQRTISHPEWKLSSPCRNKVAGSRGHTHTKCLISKHFLNLLAPKRNPFFIPIQSLQRWNVFQLLPLKPSICDNFGNVCFAEVWFCCRCLGLIPLVLAALIIYLWLVVRSSLEILMMVDGNHVWCWWRSYKMSEILQIYLGRNIGRSG